MTARSRRFGAAVIVVLAGLVLGLAACGDDDDDAGDGTTTTTIATGGIEIDAPDGWQSIPLPLLGFGLAIPEGWEATRLDEQGLASIGQAAPVVPDFADAARNAAESGAVFYAAGVEGDGKVTDLKVRAALDSGITDVAGLEAYAGELATEAGLQAPQITPVADAPQPTVDIRFSSPGVEGTERLVLSPRGVVYSLIVTSEVAAGHDELVADLLGTLAFPPASG